MVSIEVIIGKGLSGSTCGIRDIVEYGNDEAGQVMTVHNEKLNRQTEYVTEVNL